MKLFALLKKVAPVFVVLAFILPAQSSASQTIGTIMFQVNTPYWYAWSNNSGWINWLPNGGNVTITDTGLTGYIWSQNHGWINLAPTNGGVTMNATTGALGGYAWGQNTGWIDFTGVSIDSSGVFRGQTVAHPIFGTMTFDCSNCYVTTDWRSPQYRNQTPVVTGGGGGGNGPPVANPPPIVIPPTLQPTEPLPGPFLQPPTTTPVPSGTPPRRTQPAQVAQVVPTPVRDVPQPEELPPQSSRFNLSAERLVDAGRPAQYAIRLNVPGQRTENSAASITVYAPGTNAVVYHKEFNATPFDAVEWADSIPTDGLPPGTYAVVLRGQYGSQPEQVVQQELVIPTPVADAATGDVCSVWWGITIYRYFGICWWPIIPIAIVGGFLFYQLLRMLLGRRNDDEQLPPQMRQYSSYGVPPQGGGMAAPPSPRGNAPLSPYGQAPSSLSAQSTAPRFIPPVPTRRDDDHSAQPQVQQNQYTSAPYIQPGTQNTYIVPGARQQQEQQPSVAPMAQRFAPPAIPASNSSNQQQYRQVPVPSFAEHMQTLQSQQSVPPQGYPVAAPIARAQQNQLPVQSAPEPRFLNEVSVPPNNVHVAPQSSFAPTPVAARPMSQQNVPQPMAQQQYQQQFVPVAPLPPRQEPQFSPPVAMPSSNSYQATVSIPTPSVPQQASPSQSYPPYQPGIAVAQHVPAMPQQQQFSQPAAYTPPQGFVPPAPMPPRTFQQPIGGIPQPPRPAQDQLPPIRTMPERR